MLILEVIKKDHDLFRTLLGQLKAMGKREHSQEERSSLIQRIKLEVISHARAEEAVLYNSMRQADAPTDTVYNGFAEHAETEVMLHALTAADAMSVEWNSLVEKFTDSLLHHVKEEEDDLFPQVREAFSKEESERMAKAFLRLKPEFKEQNSLENAADLIKNLVAPGSTAEIKH